MISVYCSETLDGVAAAAIVMRHAVLQKLPHHFGGFLHPDRLEEELKDLAGDEHKLVFVLDVSVSPDHLSVLEKINERNKLVYWNTPDAQSVVPPSRIFDRPEGRKCAAELAKDRFLPKDRIAAQLAQLAHEVKFWELTDDHSRKLSNIIADGYNPMELLESLARGVLWNERFERFHREYQEKKRAAEEGLMRGLVIKSYVNYRFGFARAPSFLHSADACQHMLNGHAGVDVAVVLYRDGRVVFRRRDGVGINIRQVAELFGGGGREFAAGARLNTQITNENVQDVLFHIDQALKNYFLTATFK